MSDTPAPPSDRRSSETRSETRSPEARSPKSGTEPFLWALAGVCLVFGLGLALVPRPVEWNWRYAGPGVQAAGRFITSPHRGESGGFEVIQISGSRQGVAIAALQTRGTAIPGNEPYHVDNRLFPNTPRLTGDGVGFRLADGSYANLFFQTHTPPHDFREYFSSPPFVDGTLGPEDAETAVSFQVEQVPPSPRWWGLWPAAVFLLVILGGHWFWTRH